MEEKGRFSEFAQTHFSVDSDSGGSCVLVFLVQGGRLSHLWPVFRYKSAGQRALPASVVFQAPSAQKNQCARAAYFGATHPELLQSSPRLRDKIQVKGLYLRSRGHTMGK